MNRIIVSTFIIGISVLLRLPSALGADLVGNVTDTGGHPVSGVNILVQDTTGKTAGEATTDAAGHYEIGNLPPNAYDYTLNPGTTGFKSGTAVSYLDKDGLTINWKVSKGDDASALATQGGKVAIAGDPFGLSMPEFLSVVALGALGAGAASVGGYAAAGGFSSSSSPPPVAPPTSSSM
jgi:hypothetical protein